MAFRDLYVLISNEGIEITSSERGEIPMYNYIYAYMQAAGPSSIRKVEAVYRYGMQEDEMIRVSLDHLEHLSSHAKGKGSLPAILFHYTRSWNDQETSQILSNLKFLELETAGMSRQQLVLDAFGASLSIYLALTELTKHEYFQQVTPLPLEITFPVNGENPFTASIFRHYHYPLRAAALMAQNEMAVHWAIAITNFINIWSGIFVDTDLGLTPTTRAFENYLLTQIEKANQAFHIFDSTLQQLGSLNEENMRMDALLSAKMEPLVLSVKEKVIEDIRQSFQKHLSEIFRNFDSLVQDSIEEKLTQSFTHTKGILDKSMIEARSVQESTRRMYRDVEEAVKELRGIPADIIQLKKQAEQVPKLEERVRSLEGQITRLLSKLN